MGHPQRHAMSEAPQPRTLEPSEASHAAFDLCQNRQVDGREQRGLQMLRLLCDAASNFVVGAH